MKQLFLFGLALLLAGPAAAQRGAMTSAAAGGGGGGVEPPVFYVPEETPWSHVVDSMLYYVDKSQIPSGILYDRAVPLAALPCFDRFTADTTSAAHLRQAYLELFIAAYNQQAFTLTPSQFRERTEAQVRRGAVPLAMLDYRLSESAAKAGLPGADTLYQTLRQRFVEQGTPAPAPAAPAAPKL